MLLKISKGNGDWAIFDVTNVDYSSHPQQAKTQADLDHALALIQSNFEMRDLRTRKPNGSLYRYQIATLHGVDGKTVVAVFDNPAYLCNNAGDTLERISI